MEVLLACFFGLGLLISREENEACDLKPRRFVSYYVNAFLAPLMLSRLFLHMLHRNQGLFVFLFILISLLGAIVESCFTIYGVMHVFSTNCHGFYLHYFNSLFIILYGANITLVVCIFGSLLICCLPCICMALI